MSYTPGIKKPSLDLQKYSIKVFKKLGIIWFRSKEKNVGDQVRALASPFLHELTAKVAKKYFNMVRSGVLDKQTVYFKRGTDELVLDFINPKYKDIPLEPVLIVRIKDVA